jgi:group I intron endonuclease
VNRSGIYQIKNLANGHRYIGSASHFGRRWATHKKSLIERRHHSIPLQRAWDKYGEAVFEFAVLEVIPDKALLIHAEQAWIDATHPEYNVAKVAGSSLGIKRSEHTKSRLSASWTDDRRAAYAEKVKGRRVGAMSASRRANIAAALTGRDRSKDHKANLSRALGGYPVIGTHIETGAVVSAPYVSALRELGFHVEHVRDCVNGRRLTHKGFRWQRATN